MLRDPPGYLYRQAQQYGDVSALSFGRINAVLINHPDLIQKVLITDARLFHKGEGLQRAKRLLGEGLLTSEDELHRRQRRLLQPVFLRSRIQNYAEAIGQRALATSQRWKDGQEVDMAHEMSRLTMAIVGETLFSADVEGDAGQIGFALDESMRLFNALSSPLAPLFELLPFGPSKDFANAKNSLDSTIYRLIEERHRSNAEHNDFLSLLLESRYDDGSQMDDTQIRDEAMTIFLAGYETTSNALSWTWSLLAVHPQYMEKLALEARHVLQGRAARMEDLDQLVYTRAVLSESMRVRPPAWLLGRKALTDYKLTHEGQDYLVPQDTTVVMSQWVMHRDPRFWDEPERFNPERWSTDDSTSRPRFTYFPFGGGMRQCIGEGFAWMEAILILATLAQNWEAHLLSDAPIKMRPSITLRPVGLKMRLKKQAPLTA